MQLEVNAQRYEIDPSWRDDTLLSVLRDALGLVGAKFGCGVGVCGACTVLVNGEAARSCGLAARDAAGKSITTIEGLAQGDLLHPVQQAWLDEAVTQCGFCQSGQIMATVALLSRNATPSHADIDTALDGNLCRCGTQQRIRAAVYRAAAAMPATMRGGK